MHREHDGFTVIKFDKKKEKHEPLRLRLSQQNHVMYEEMKRRRRSVPDDGSESDSHESEATWTYDC